MAERKRQFSTYTDDELGDLLVDASEQHNMSIAEILRQGARREINQMESNDP